MNPADDLDARVALPEKAAGRLAGVTPRQLRYWENIALLRPTISRRVGASRSVRLCGFPDLVELLVVAQPRTRMPWWSPMTRSSRDGD